MICVRSGGKDRRLRAAQRSRPPKGKHPPIPRSASRAPREWIWQWVFPATRTYTDPATGDVRRHHLHETVIQRAVRKAAIAAGITKLVTPPTLRHSFAIHMLQDGYGIRTIQELLGLRDVSTIRHTPTSSIAAALACVAHSTADSHRQSAGRIDVIRHPPQTKEPASSGKYAGSWTLRTEVGRPMRRAFRWDNVILRRLIDS
jgi:hypothetical protein